MAIKIVTDSTSDIPHVLAERYGITVVPVYVQFGNKTYRDRIDITDRYFMKGYCIFRLIPPHPNPARRISSPFIKTYRKRPTELFRYISPAN